MKFRQCSKGCHILYAIFNSGQNKILQPMRAGGEISCTKLASWVWQNFYPVKIFMYTDFKYSNVGWFCLGCWEWAGSSAKFQYCQDSQLYRHWSWYWYLDHCGNCGYCKYSSCRFIQLTYILAVVHVFMLLTIITILIVCLCKFNIMFIHGFLKLTFFGTCYRRTQ